MPTSDQDEDNVLDTASESSTEATSGKAVQDEIADSSTAEADTSTGSPDVPAKSAREQLVEQLSTGKDPDAEDDTPEDVDAEESADDDTVSEESTEADEESEDEKREKALLAPLAENTKQATKDRFSALIEDRKKLKPDADFGKQVSTYLQQTKLSPKAFGEWLEFGAEVYKDPGRAAQVLLEQAKAVAKQYNVELPVESTVQTGLTPDKLSEFDGHLLDLIESGEVTAEAGKKMREWVLKQKTEAPKPKPAAQTQEKPAARQATEQETQARDTEYLAVVQTADKEIRKLDAQYASELPADWAKIRPSVIKSMTENYKGTDPASWPKIFKREVDLARAKFSSKKPPVQTKPLRATAQSTETSAEPMGRKALVAELTGKRR